MSGRRCSKTDDRKVGPDHFDGRFKQMGNREFSHIASLQDVSRLITDSGLDPASVKALEDKKVKVTAVPLSKRG